MKILAIETATIVCGAAPIVDGSVRAERGIQEKNVHAERIMGLIDDVVNESRVSLNELDAIAVSIGPGSFTGLRIGLSVAKGLCFALEKPLVAVPTLQALVRRAVDAGVVATPFLLPAIDARRDEVYCQLFRVDGKRCDPEWDARDFSLAHLFQELRERDVTVTGDAIAKIRLHHDSLALKYVSGEFAMCSAATVGLIGEEMAMRGEFADARTVEPKYIKEFFSNR